MEQAFPKEMTALKKVLLGEDTLVELVNKHVHPESSNECQIHK